MFKSKNFRLAVVVASVIMFTASGAWAQRSARRGAAGMLGAVPADSLLCVRINRLDNSLGTVNAFLEGIAPENFDAKALVSKLGSLLGDERLRGVNKNGNFALFAVIVPSDSANQNPMANLFLGALLPVRNYDNFISRNPNCGEPDDEGISTITVDGRSRALVTRFRRFALLCPPDARKKLPPVKEMMAQRKNSLAGSLDENGMKLAADSSVWLSLNVKQAGPLIKPMVLGKLEQIKGEMKKSIERGNAPMMVDPEGVMNFYGEILKMLIEGTDRIAIGLLPSPEACNVTFCLKPIPETDMAVLVGQELGGDLDRMLGYLEDDAMMNMATKVDRKSLNAAYMGFLDLFGKMEPDGISESDLEEVKALTTKTINALGDSLAITARIDPKGAVPFRAKYVLEVRDEEAFKQALEKSFQMIEEGAFDKLYKGFGMEMDIEIERNADTYKGIPIDRAKVKFKMGEDESMQGMAIAKMFGDGLEYRLAFVEGHCIYTIGADANKTIRELIDQVRAGGPKQINSEMRAALDATADSEQADLVGTFNVVRYFQMIAEMLGSMAAASDSDMQKLEAKTMSNIAFAGRTQDGKATFQIVLPKSHLQEIKTAFETVIPQIEKQAKLQRQQQQ
jgi:hypothetical protein